MTDSRYEKTAKNTLAPGSVVFMDREHSSKGVGVFSLGMQPGWCCCCPCFSDLFITWQQSRAPLFSFFRGKMQKESSASRRANCAASAPWKTVQSKPSPARSTTLARCRIMRLIPSNSRISNNKEAHKLKVLENVLGEDMHAQRHQLCRNRTATYCS